MTTKVNQNSVLVVLVLLLFVWIFQNDSSNTVFQYILIMNGQKIKILPVTSVYHLTTCIRSIVALVLLIVVDLLRRAKFSLLIIAGRSAN